ncbi:hypothetical protein [Bradyrhizobium sp. CCBAU 45394]|uniref:hypothetical protein n=1 Tax=Bradyrhizobium sp. CCBAU 45394 TaxID=1325087 RepID=UPI002302F95D|nr:hypothetical protein [Bradyrhizobium sp. CCBAU 45394]
MAKKYSTEEFIILARAVHGDRYDYTATQYRNRNQPVKFLCVEHGEISQKPQYHLRGSGCTACGYASKRSKTQVSTEEFVLRAKKVHGEKYDYSDTTYVIKRQPVTISCRQHGPFTQMPGNHLSGHGCPACHRGTANNHKLSKAQYIARAKSVHGDTYDYSKTEYVHSQTSLAIICRTHGIFQLNAAYHLQGRGCKACAQLRRRPPTKVDIEEFIRRSNERHNRRYDYSRVQFIAVKDLVTIGCPDHGDFVQSARSHYQGNGCPQCGRMRKNLISIYREEFVQEARAIHGEQFDYSRVIFKSKRNHEKVEIVCRHHGVFLQNPMNHLRGSGCPQCAGNAPGTTNSFVKSARQVHGEKYDYGNVIYITSNFPIRITCRNHGDFVMGPAMHLTGRGCRQCSDERRTELSRTTTEEFVAAARGVHGDTFDYSDVKYINNNERVIIRCRSHGVFDQLPRSHLSGIGCARCSSSKGEGKIRTILQQLKIDFREQVNFPDLIFPETGGRLRFDFYVDATRTAIEFDGAQHFEPINFTGLDESDLQLSFEQLQKRDAFKTRYCETNGIRLIRIPYTEIEAIGELLEELFGPNLVVAD